MRRGGLALAGLVATLGLSGCDDDAADPGDASAERRDATELAVCRFNSDCAPGYYCRDRRCDLDCREDRDCEPAHTCQSGRCVPDAVEPVPCVADTACGAPAGICEGGRCVSGCVTAGCPDDGSGQPQTCGPSTGRCAPFDCRRDGCTPTAEVPEPVCEAASGRCVAPPDPVEVCGERCRDDEYCDPELRRCVLRPPSCTPADCAANERCDEVSGECVALPFDCRRDGCPRPEQVCNAQSGTCGDPAPFDCNLGDPCPPGTQCVVLTGQCEAGPVGRATLGEPCARASACESDVCLGIQGRPEGFCSKPCCAETDCPAGFGCLYSAGAGGRACMPAALFPTSNFSVGAGGACGGAFNDCRSGLCLQGRCMGTCCTDLDCLGATCVVLPTSDGSARAACDIPNLLGGPPGSLCYGELDCWNRICLIHPEATPDNVFGFCSDTCCTHTECQAAFGPGYGCGLTGFFDLNQSLTFTLNACAPLPFGQRPDGEACATDADCQSAACMEGFCRQPCCHDRHCTSPERCLPRVNTENVLQRVCETPTPPPQDP